MKHRISTTISAKHWKLLKKYTEKFETQQKALEFALENLESGKQDIISSPEDRFWSQMRQFKSVCHLHKDLFLELIRTADYDRVSELLITMKLAEYQMVLYYQKPLEDLSLKEVIDGIIFTSRIGNWLESIEYRDDGSYYTLMATHNAKNRNYSNMFKIFLGTLFESYGVKTESKISENSLFMRVFKNS